MNTFSLSIVDKSLKTKALENVLVQGEKNVTKVSIALRPTYGDIDLTALNWQIKGLYANGMEATAPLTKTTMGTTTLLNWTVGVEFTTYSGKLNLTLIGTDGDSDPIVKFKGEYSINILPDPTGSNLTLNTVETLTTLATEKAAEAAQSAADAQEIKNAIDARDDAAEVYEAYDDTKTYIPLNKVTLDGSSFINVEPCTGVTPTIDITTPWLCIAEKGYTPQKGIDYDDGADGASAYDAAVAAGYTGTEAEFNAATAKIPDHDTRITNVENGTGINDGVITDAKLSKTAGQVFNKVQIMDAFFDSSDSIRGSEWEIGSIVSTTGINTPIATRIRTKTIRYFPKDTVFKLSDLSLRLGFVLYDSNGAFLSGTGLADLHTYTLTQNSYLRIVVAYDDNRDMTNLVSAASSTVKINSGISVAYKELQKLERVVENISDVSAFPDFAFDVPVTLTYIADHCFVKDELWIFNSTADDTHTSYAVVRRYSINFETKTGAYLGSFNHNWGHVNSIDYCEDTDTLICGNGSGVYTTGIGEIYLIPNAYALKDLTDAPFETYVQVIDVHTAEDWGSKHNAIWGESNSGKFNICYVITNDNKNVKKVLLGQGDNDLGKGVLIEGKSGLQFNGTYKVLATYSQSDGLDVLQGCKYHNGQLYEILGHARFWMSKNKLNDDGTITKSQYIDRIYDDSGVEVTTAAYLSGVDIKNGYLIVCSTSGTLKFYNL